MAPAEQAARRGPRPVVLHLMLAMLSASSSLAASPSSNAGSPDWSASGDPEKPPEKPSPPPPRLSPLRQSARLQSIAAALRSGNAEAAFPAALLREAVRRHGDLLRGIAAYRAHPHRRRLTEPPTVWEEGGSRLLDYGAGGAHEVTALVVPSLVNRASVLDLDEGHSMLRWLAQAGIRPLLLDWGWPGETERRFTFTDYVAGRLERALTKARQIARKRVALVGYCMGGDLALAAAQRRPDLVRGLGLLATPWDFHAGNDGAALARLLPVLEPMMAAAHTLPIDALQTLFALLEPFGVVHKYAAFSRLDPDGERARLFVALEDWLNDGVPLAEPVARECLAGWYGRNDPVNLRWRIAGAAVDPKNIKMPAYVAVPGRDRIVPPSSALPLAFAIPGALVHQPHAGHVGMVAGSSAERALWQSLHAWLATLVSKRPRR
jgi:polyhydroxyalkanoate synthase subunit PhaC